MKIAIATFAGLPNPPVKGGAVEALIDDICKINEIKNQLSIDVFSVYDKAAIEASNTYRNTNFIFYKKYISRRINKKSIAYKLFHRSIPDKTMSGIIKLINQNKYDYVIITSINYEMEYIFQAIHSKVIWYLHGDPLSVLQAEAIKKITEHCAAVITVSDFVNKRVSSVLPKCKVITVRNCTDLQPISLSEEDSVRQEIRGKIGITDNDKLIVYIGRITPIKGIYELVEAFVFADIPNTKLLIVGTPSEEGEERYFDKIKGVANQNVYYWGYAVHDSLNKLYCAADCIAAPSVCQEAALLIALEASICNRPLITTNIGGIPEYTDDNAIMIEYDAKFREHLIEAMKVACAYKVEPKKNNTKRKFVDEFYDDFYKALKQLNKEINTLCQE